MPDYTSKEAFLQAVIDAGLADVSGLTQVEHMAAKDAASSDFGPFWYYVHFPHNSTGTHGEMTGGGVNDVVVNVDIYIGGRAGNDPRRTGVTHTVGATKSQAVYQALLTLPWGQSAEIGVTTVRIDGVDVRETVKAFDDNDPLWRGLIQCTARCTEIY